MVCMGRGSRSRPAPRLTGGRLLLRQLHDGVDFPCYRNEHVGPRANQPTEVQAGDGGTADAEKGRFM